MEFRVYQDAKFKGKEGSRGIVYRPRSQLSMISAMFSSYVSIESNLLALKIQTLDKII